eukprot:GHUV01028617.1.p1 GENE.GHUV01028617.1~~GHUV01028617.1.p1  ORF type:complete len:155 (+),score=13.94 GHUV01028617.1:510-974(+)
MCFHSFINICVTHSLMLPRTALYSFLAVSFAFNSSCFFAAASTAAGSSSAAAAASSSVLNSFAAVWKLFTVLPRPLPSSGSLLGPKISAATPAMTAISGKPRPNRPWQTTSLCCLCLVYRSGLWMRQPENFRNCKATTDSSAEHSAGSGQIPRS